MGHFPQKKTLKIVGLKPWILPDNQFNTHIFSKGGEAIVNSKHFVKDHLGLDMIINQSV